MSAMASEAENSRAFVTMLQHSPHGAHELWLVVKDTNGCIMPVGSTGPIKLPPEWAAALKRRGEEL